MKKIAIVGTHGTGKTKICERIKNKICNNYFELARTKINKDKIYGPTEIYYEFNNKFVFIPEQFREIVKEIGKLDKQTEEITLATYAKQLYLENLYIAQGKNILCDRSLFDTFMYYGFFNNLSYYNLTIKFDYSLNDANLKLKKYSKIYLIEPSDREIESDGFRLTDKKQQLEIHKLFLEYFKYFNNVEIVNQEDAHKEEFVEKVVKEFNI